MMRGCGFIVLLLGLTVLAGCREPVGPHAVPEAYAVVPLAPERETDVTAELEALQKVRGPAYRITAQDHFRISVYEHDELQVPDVVVTPDGYIAAPLIGPVKIGDLTLTEATELLRKRYADYIVKPVISLIPLAINGSVFTIVGKVNAPGRYPISGRNFRVADTIATARGLMQGMFNGDTVDTADLHSAYMVRDGKVLPVDFNKVVHDGNALHNIPIIDGDYIFIPSEMSTAVYILGEVTHQTYVGFKEGMTLLKALSYAKGALEDTRSRYVHVVRGGLKNSKLYKLDLTRILAGEAMDFKLAPNDVVYVPRSDLATWNQMVREIIPTLQGINMMAGPFGSPSAYFNAQ